MDDSPGKCPACGTTLVAEVDECPECGLSFVPNPPVACSNPELQPLHQHVVEEGLSSSTGDSQYAESPTSNSDHGNEPTTAPLAPPEEAPVDTPPEESPAVPTEWKCPKCGATHPQRTSICTRCGVHLVAAISSSKRFHAPWRTTALIIGICAALGCLAWLLNAWRTGDFSIPYDERALTDGAEYWVPRLIVFAFIAMWVYFARELWRRRHVRKKYPHGFRYQGEVYVPLSRKRLTETDTALPEIDESDVPMIEDLSLHYENQKEGVIYYETGVPDMGRWSGG